MCVPYRKNSFHHHVSCSFSSPSVPLKLCLFSVSIQLGEVQLTPGFTSFHIKASPRQLQKHLWNVCCFFGFFFKTGNVESGVLRATVWKPSMSVCVRVCAQSTLGPLCTFMWDFKIVEKLLHGQYGVEWRKSSLHLWIVGELWPLTLANTHTYINGQITTMANPLLCQYNKKGNWNSLF